MNKLDEKTAPFLRFHSREWVEELKTKVKELIGDNNDQIDAAINHILWSPEKRPVE